MSDVINMPVRYVATDLDPIMQPDPLGAWVRMEDYDAQTDRIVELEAKLAKAVELALEECPFSYGTGGYGEWWYDRRNTIAELSSPVKGETDE